MDINEMENRIRSKEGYRINSLMLALDISLQLFKNNYHAFLKVTDMFKMPVFSSFFWADSEESELFRKKYQVEVYRTFTNFAASAAALIDHSRRFIGKDIKDEIKNHYEQKVQKCFSKNVLAKFIKDFRNYLLHRGYPSITISTNIQGEPSFTLNKYELMEWEKWSSESMKYIKAQGDAISIITAASDYYQLVETFYTWLFSELKTAYKNEFAEVNDLIQQFNAPLNK